MNKNDAVALVKQILGFRSDQDANIITRMDMVQALLEKGNTLPWFLVEESHPLSVAAGGDPTIPTGFIREVEYDHGLYWRESSTTTPKWLQKIGYDEGLEKYGDEPASDYPTAYAIRKTTFYLFPKTSAAVTLYFDYYKADATVTATGGSAENSWLANAPYLLVGNAGASLAQTLRNPGAQKEFVEMATIAWRALLQENALRQSANRQYQLGRNS